MMGIQKWKKIMNKSLKKISLYFCLKKHNIIVNNFIKIISSKIIKFLNKKKKYSLYNKQIRLLNHIIVMYCKK